MEKNLKGLNNSVISIDSIPIVKSEPEVKIRLRNINSGRPVTNAYFNKEQLEELIIELQKRLAEM